MNIDYPSITKFRDLVELKDFQPATKKEYVRYLRRLADHFQSDPATLCEDQLRQYFLSLRQHKKFSARPCRSPRPLSSSSSANIWGTPTERSLANWSFDASSPCRWRSRARRRNARWAVCDGWNLKL
jgi:hypothetical protein